MLRYSVTTLISDYAARLLRYYARDYQTYYFLVFSRRPALLIRKNLSRGPYQFILGNDNLFATPVITIFILRQY